MMRLCNDIYKSTVHRVYNRTPVERISMPFFFGTSSHHVYKNATYIVGLNFNCVEGVIPTCASETNPPLYEPISCGDCKSIVCKSLNVINSCAGCLLRPSLGDRLMKEKMAAQKKAPSAVIVAAEYLKSGK